MSTGGFFVRARLNRATILAKAKTPIPEKTHDTQLGIIEVAYPSMGAASTHAPAGDTAAPDRRRYGKAFLKQTDHASKSFIIVDGFTPNARAS